MYPPGEQDLLPFVRSQMAWTLCTVPEQGHSIRSWRWGRVENTASVEHIFYACQEPREGYAENDSVSLISLACVTGKMAIAAKNKLCTL